MKLSSLVLEMEGVKTESSMESLEEQLEDCQVPWEEMGTDLLAEEGMEIAQIDHLEEVETIPTDLLEEEETEIVQTDLSEEEEMETVLTDLLEEVEIIQIDQLEEM